MADAGHGFPRTSLHHHQLEPLGVLEQILEKQYAVALLGAQVAASEQAAEPAPSGAVARIGENVRRAVGEHETRAGMIVQAKLLLALGKMRTHHAGDRVAVGEAEPRKPDLLRLHRHNAASLTPPLRA
jgi:hypothetical protein